MSVASPGNQGRAGKKAKTSAIPRRTDGPRSDEIKTAEALLPLAAIALRLLDESRAATVTYLAADERRAEMLGTILRRLVPKAEILVFPPWDCLPFDRASPSRDSMGRRMRVLQALATERQGTRIVLSSVEAALQRVPPQAAICEASVTLAVGATVDDAALQAFADRAGYNISERVQEAGDIHCNPHVIEVFPPGSDLPFRIHIEDSRVSAIATFDPLNLRSVDAVEALCIGPASEIIRPAESEPVGRDGGLEHRLPDHYPETLPSLFDALPDSVLLLAPETDARSNAFFEQLTEAHQARISLPGEHGSAVAPERLYLTREAWAEMLERHEERDIVDRALEPTPDFSAETKPVHAFQAYLQSALEAGTTVVLAGVRRDLSAFGRFLERHDGLKPVPAEDWTAVEEGKAGSFFSLELDLDEGIVDTERGIALITAGDVLGTRAHREGQRGSNAAALLAEPPMRIGDTVIHEDHGIGILRGVETLEIDGTTTDAVRLEYHRGASLLAPASDLDRLWRYGSDEEAVPLDRLHTEAWSKRRIEVEIAVRAIAEQLVKLASEKASIAAPKLISPRRDYEKFAARFPYPETPDQARGIAAVLADLASGHPMDRLVCGDVGFGKTEVALRAAAAAALAGKQVAVVAPTTVLARQHLQTFQKRFAPFGIEVAGLSRLVGATEAKRVKAGLADGTIRIVVGTQAIGGAGVSFADLGLLIIDEEQKFGAKLKHDLRALAAHGHVLTLTATPIPRTLQMAMVGIQAVSVIATPPSRRRPIRTVVIPFDAASVRIALLREHARNGQSFVVVPRIEDIEPMRERLASIVPELAVSVAHGELPAEDVDRTMVGFGDGNGDVLLATNIIESGLDVPRANTMLIWHADRFGLAQLHQLRGRVGRGRLQGMTYLLTDPETELGETTQARLSTLASLDRLGAGLAISARDLDLRGAGDLVGDEQAGHMRLIGLGLYQTLLGRAVRLAKGEPVLDEAPPEIHLEMAGRIPATYVGEDDLRIELYGRLARLTEPKAIRHFEEEVEDRFGEPPKEVLSLFALARLRSLCHSLSIASLNAGPKAIALVFRPEGLARVKPWLDSQPHLTLKGNKLVWEQETSADAKRLSLVETLLDDLSEASSKHAEPAEEAADPTACERAP